MEPEVVEVVARPRRCFTRLEVPALALYAQRAQASPDVRVQRVEAPIGVSRREVVAPPAQDRVEIGDDVAEVRVTPARRGQLLHARTYAFHRADGRLALEEVHPSVILLPDRTAHALAHRAAEEIEALLTIEEI